MHAYVLCIRLSVASVVRGSAVWLLALLVLILGNPGVAGAAPGGPTVLPNTSGGDDLNNLSGLPSACLLEDDANCKLFDGLFIVLSDRLRGVRWADDFRPDASPISRVCWWPCYFNLFGFEECAQNPPPDDFIVRFYEDDGGLFGAELGPPGGQPLVPDAKEFLGSPFRCWSDTAPLGTPIDVTPGACYWIEITGLGSPDGCSVFLGSSTEGNVYSLLDQNASYSREDVIGLDLAVCLDSGLASSNDCGPVAGACCFCDGNCLDAGNGMDHSQCAQQNGSFHPGKGCNEVTCSAPPTNDNCANSIVLTHPGGNAANEIVVNLDTECANGDGPSPVPDCDGFSAPVGADIWYDYTAPCSGDLNVSLCDGTEYDNVVVVYGPGGGTCACPTDDSTQLACGDDSCGLGGGPAVVDVPVTQGDCYTIRVGGWDGDFGTGTMRIRVTCEPLPTPTVSQWGLIVLGLLLLAGAKIHFTRRRITGPA
ncbi:MAG: IPTL-CTERM sorting domain-containing protein [Planctomycetes bacterium]|nr:IPTL-CTERM sorting domain-containing protein [Planctomycetota bacterium]